MKLAPKNVTNTICLDCLYILFTSEGIFLTDWTSFMSILEAQRDGHGIKILTTSKSNKVILAVHWVIFATRFYPGLIWNTAPIVPNFMSRRPNPIFNFPISLWL